MDCHLQYRRQSASHRSLNPFLERDRIRRAIPADPWKLPLPIHMTCRRCPLQRDSSQDRTARQVMTSEQVKALQILQREELGDQEKVIRDV
jgi:hypothetical protein